MYESEVTEIEKLISNQNQWREKCINLIASEMDKKPVKEEVNRFRAKYKKIKYSYDSAEEKKKEPAVSKKLKN